MTITVGMNSDIAALTELDLTTWLKMVWTALDEEDQGKRERMLQDANNFRTQDHPQSSGLRYNVISTPFRFPCDCRILP